ncbi:MAG: ATP-binding protein [Bacteroidetes bacterium]|nr:ATP-binding protein [Bacteroidota bacterium]
MEKLRNDSINIINSIDTSFIRDFANTIDWKDRLIGIKGARGVGKTTLLLQYIKRNLPISQSLYVSLDNIYFSSNILVDLADEFVKTGGEYLILDEVHRYSNWSIEIKNIYDTHKNLKVIFTGSSILHIDHRKADLSRRVVFYEMPGFSLREYINIKTENAFGAVSFEDILKNHQELSIDITKNIKPIALYNDYNRIGYYPFFLENEATYHKKIEEIINVVMEIDIPQSFEISLQSIEKMKKLLYIISSSTPFKPNIVKLSEKIGATRNTIKTYLHYLERAKIIQLLQSDTKGVSILQKPEKIYLYHPNLMYAFTSEKSNIGTNRETFFYNQVGASENLTSSKRADFIVNDKYTIEVGGKNKDKSQISGIENAFIAADNIEHGFGNKIPLWLFGFLY